MSVVDIIASKDTYATRINTVPNIYYAHPDLDTLVAYSYYDGKSNTTEIGRPYLRFDLSSLAGATITSAVLYFNVYYVYQPVALRQTAGEIDPDTGDDETIFNNANGTLIANLEVATGWNNTDVASYVDAQKGGDCDFGFTLQNEAWGGSVQLYSREEPGLEPYLHITYTAGGGGSSIKTVNGLAKASVKTVNGLAVASVKTWNGLA